ncbi:MAG: hypothetical protein K0R84_158, partial [Clostridia bacterium]|nr:hypothetical protein [Clostridia bacterium]
MYFGEGRKLFNKKTFRRIISYVIIIVFLLQSTLGVFADSAGKNPAADNGAKLVKKELPKAAMAKTEKLHKLPPGLVKKEDALDRWKGKKEIIESRTENSKTYQNEDGTYTTAVFMSPIHIKDNKGNLIDIDNTLVPLETGEYSHKNKLGAFDVFFAGEDKETGSIKVEKDNISVEMTSKDATTKNMAVEGSSVLYQGTESGVEHLYTVDFNGVKEDIILNRSIDEPVFIYELDVKGPADVIQQENLVLVVDQKSGEPVFTLSAPFMEDKEGSQSFNLSMQLSQEKGKNIVTVTADKQWLDDPARVYPVRIDPSIGVEYSKDKDMVDDNFTQVYKPWLTHYDEEYIYVGYDNGIKSTNGSDAKGKTRGYIKFDIPDAVKQNEGIISAEIGLYKYTHWSSSTRQMNVWELPENTSINNLTWTNQPQPGNTILTVPITSYVGWYKLNVTQMMNTWVTRDNFVLGMKMQDESNSADCFRSTDYKTSSMWPYLKITYNKEPIVVIPIEQGDLELVLERDDKMQTGTAYAKATLEGGSPESGENKATIEYKLMPDGPSGTIVEENFGILDWETEKFDLQVDKTYWIEANVKLEHLIVPVSEDPLIPPPEPYYEEVLNETKQTSKFVVGEVQPGDTLKRLSKHYLNAGGKYTEISQLNKLSEEALTVGQKLFVLTDKSKALSYKQPQQITPAIELKDMTAGSQPVNTELVGQFINPHNGNFAYSNVDFGYSSYNLDIALVRSHSSIVENRKSPLGDKWDYSFNKYLFFYNDGTIGYNTGDGSRIYFRQQGGVYKTSAPVYDVLTKTGDYYEIKTADNIRYQFSNTGLLTKILDKNNNETIVEYNDNDWQSTIKDAAARMIAFDYYDSDTQWSGNIRTVTMPDGSAVNYTYDSGANTLASYIDPEGYETVYSYDGKQRLQTLTNARGIIGITNGYDGSGRVQTQYDGKNVPVKLQYSAEVTTFTDGKGYPYYYSYNDKLWLTNKKYPDSISESYTHNAKGDINTRMDRMGKTHSYDYNALGFVIKYTRPDTKYMEYRYKNDYLLEYIRDFEGNQTNLYYDGNNNLDREVRYVTDNGQRVQVTTDYSFTPEGLIASVSDPDGATTTFDNSGYPLYQAVSEEGNDPYHYYFDSMGRLTTMIDPKFNMTNTTYDNRGNATFVIFPGSYDIDRYTIYNYDENGNLISQTSSRVLPIGGIQPTTIYSYDNNDRLETITDPYGYKTSYSYDKNGNLELEKDQEDYETTYVYDNLNRLKNIKYPGQTGYAYTYEYDDLGNTKKVTEADGDWTS